MYRIFTAVIATSLLHLAACGGDTPAETEPMTATVTTLGTELTELTELAEAHHTTVAAATALTAVTTEETAYQTAALAHHDEMHHELGEMAACSQSGSPPSTTAMADLVEEIEAELAKHETDMAAAADIAAAQTEETRHDTALATMLTDAAAAQTTLATDAADFSCPHHTDTGGTTH